MLLRDDELKKQTSSKKKIHKTFTHISAEPNENIKIKKSLK